MARPAGARAALTRLEVAVGAQCSAVASARERNQNQIPPPWEAATQTGPAGYRAKTKQRQWKKN